MQKEIHSYSKKITAGPSDKKKSLHIQRETHKHGKTDPNSFAETQPTAVHLDRGSSEKVKHSFV